MRKLLSGLIVAVATLGCGSDGSDHSDQSMRQSDPGIGTVSLPLSACWAGGLEHRTG